MTQCKTILALCGLLIGGGLFAVEDDAVAKKLASAKALFAKELEETRARLTSDLKKKAEIVQKAGDLKELEKVEEEIKTFGQKNELPASVPKAAYVRAVKNARVKMNSAYDLAVKRYTMDGNRVAAKAVQAEWDDYKKGIGDDATNEPTADDGFAVGTKLIGTHSLSRVKDGKSVSWVSNWEFVITKRSGKDFTAEVVWGRDGVGAQVDGTIENHQVKFSQTKALPLGGNFAEHITIGRFEKGVLTGVTTINKKSDPTFKGKLKLKVSKDE